MLFWIAQIFGTLGLVAMVIGLFQNDRKKMLSCVVLNGLTFSVEYLLLGAFSAMWSNLFGIVRTALCIKRETDERFSNYGVLAFIMGVYLIIGLVSFEGPVSLLPIIAEEIYVFSLWQSDVRHIRYGTACMVVFWLVYDLIVCAYPSAICDAIVLASTIIAIISKNGNNSNTCEVC